MKSFVITIAMLISLSGSPIIAQEPDVQSGQKKHAWLKQFNGTWTSTSQSVAAGDQPAMECSGSMNSQMLGEFWVINNMEGDVGGQTFTAIQTIGYDTEKKKYVGTWVDSMMNYMWQYEGHVDASGKKLILVAEGPNFMAQGKLTQFRDSYEFKSADLISATSEMKGEDGKWVAFMTGEIKRSKP